MSNGNRPMLAPNYLDQLFADLPVGQRLLASVRGFYGPAFRVDRHDTADRMSWFSIVTGGPALKLAEAVICLNTTTDRITAAALHELLHLSLPMRGFNIINAVDCF